MPKKTARRIIDTKKATGTTIISGVTVSGSPGSGASAAMAGAGLTYSSGVLDVGAGTLITVGADSVGITTGSTYQYIGTGSGTAAAWQNLSALAGAGLTHSAGVLAVGAGNGITVNADDVALTTPGTLTVSSSNSSTGNHTHAVTSSADVTAGTTSLLASLSGNLKLATGNIGSTLGYNGTFTSGFAGAGWRVDYGVTEALKASAEFDNLTIRGRMRVYELLIQQIRATNGSVFVSSSSKVKTVTNTTGPNWEVNGVQLTFNGDNATLTFTWCDIATADTSDIDGGNDRQLYHGFLVGDVTRAQEVRWDGSEFAGIIQSNLEVTSVGGLYEYGAALVSGDAPAVGYDYVRLGSRSDTTRQGTVYLTSDDSNAPFIDIVDGVTKHADWNTAGKIRARLGKLSGITDSTWGTLSGYGLWSDNVYLTGSIYATDGIFNGTVYATDGIFSGTVYASAGTFTGAITAQSGSIDGFLTIGTSGGIYQGTGTAASPTTGLKIWNDSGVGRMAGYNSGSAQWTIGTDGKFYSADSDGDALRIDSTGVRLRITTGSETFSSITWVRPIDTADKFSDYHSQLFGTYISGTKTTNMYLRSYVNTDTDSSYIARTVVEAQAKVSGTTSGASIEVYRTRTSYYIEMNGASINFNGYTRFLISTAPSGSPPSGYLYAWFSSSGSNYVWNVKNSSGTTKSVTLT